MTVFMICMLYVMRHEIVLHLRYEPMHFSSDRQQQTGCILTDDSNGTKWMIETDINDSNFPVVIVTAIHFESFAS